MCEAIINYGHMNNSYWSAINYKNSYDKYKKEILASQSVRISNDYLDDGSWI